jgi:hypothetical protein
MDDLLVFIAGLSEVQKEKLLVLFSSERTLSARLLCLLLSGKTIEEARREISTTTSAFYKIGTEARQELLREIEKFADTPYDGIYVLRDLVLNGRFTTAKKLFVQQEKYFEEKQQWQHLELLYIEGTRLCQATGNLRLGRELSAKRKKNSERLKEFIRLSAELNILLFEFEVYEQKKLPSHFLKDMELMLKQARTCKHYTLVHNALQLQYLYYSRYSNKPAMAKKLATEIYRNRQKNLRQLNPITAVLALNVYLNYLSIYSGELPEQLVQEIGKQIAIAGRHAVFNSYYALLDYHLYENNFSELKKLLGRLQGMEDNTKFNVYRHGILALKAFSEKNEAVFKAEVANFYADASRLDFPEVECMLRICESLFLIGRGKTEDAAYKINSLRVFIDRNLSERYNYEKEITAFLNKAVKKTATAGQKQQFIHHLHRSPYRNIRFLSGLLQQYLS